MTKIICIGSAAKDIFFPTREAKIISNEGSSTEKELIAFEYGAKYQIEDRFEALGGCAANASLAMAKLGLAVSCVSRIGKDTLGNEILEIFKKSGVDTSLLQIDENSKSDLSFILVNENDGERTIFFNRDSNEKLVMEPGKIEGNWILVSALNGNWKSHLDVIAKMCQEKNMQLAYNPGQANMKEDLEKVREFSSRADILILNKDEAIEIVGEELSDEELVKKLSENGPGVVAMTMGKDGAIGINLGEIKKVGSLEVEAKDSTGAGDAFTGTFLAAHIQGKDLEESLKWGAINGANVVKFYGASMGHLSESEIVSKLDSVK